MKKFEVKILTKLLKEKGLDEFIELLKSPKFDIDYSGVGYFLTIKDDKIPSERIVLDTPVIEGKLGDKTVGFLAFIESSELTLECYSYEDSLDNKDRAQNFKLNAK